MLNSLIRKSQQVLSDPTLRAWMLGRALGRYSAAPPALSNRPPYLLPTTELDPGKAETPKWSTINSGTARKDIEATLPGAMVVFGKEDPGKPFGQEFDDLECKLALHRFAWLPLSAAPPAAADLFQVWTAWVDRYFDDRGGWAWNAYTASERAINIIDYAHQYGWAGNADQLTQQLAAHAPVILDRLEYDGEGMTSNHLANNGRGLYRLGCALGMADSADIGFTILDQEAARLFLPSGVLREGSWHYHYLYLRNYADCWLAARKAGRPQAELARLAEITKSAAGAAHALALPNDVLPLIGDISPDSPPEYVSGLQAGKGGWAKRLAPEDHADLASLVQAVPKPPVQQMDEDGWVLFDQNGWQGIWPWAPGGWAPMPGHGHVDLGAPVLSYLGEALFIDPGRGQYGDTGDAALYREAAVHGLFTLNRKAPFPANKPYYTDTFRQSITGPAPHVFRKPNGLRLEHHGYSRLGLGPVVSEWTFKPQSFNVADHAPDAPKGTLRTRSLITSLPVRRLDNNQLQVSLSDQSLILTTSQDAQVNVEPLKIWTAYGKSALSNQITVSDRVKDPTKPLITSVEVTAT